MKFRSRKVVAEDCQLNWEQQQATNDAQDATNAAQVITNARVTRGTGTVTITDGTSDTSGSIAHGHTSTPTAIVATARRTADTRDDYICNIASRDATNFTMGIRGGEADAFPIANPTTITFDWIAFL